MTSSICNRLVSSAILATSALAGLGLLGAVQAATDRPTQGAAVAGQGSSMQVAPKAAPKDAPMKTIIDQVRIGKFDAGREAFSAYVKEHRTSVEVATASLEYARELVSVVKTAKGTKDRKLLAEALPHLEATMAEGTPTEQLKARNVYAAAAVSLGRTGDALAVLEAGYTTAQTVEDPAVRARYLYQFGNAVERYKSPAESLRYYVEAFDADRDYVRAGGSAWNLAVANSRYSTAADVFKKIIDAGYCEKAKANFSRLLLSRFHTPESQEPMLDRREEFTEVVFLLFDLLPACQVSEQEFREAWWPGLETSRLWLLELAEPMYDPPNEDPVFNPPETLKQAYRRRANYLELVLLGYEPDLPVMGSRREARKNYAPLVDRLAKPSEYLSATGEKFAAGGEFNRAFALYTTAFWLDRNNLIAALNAANLILALPDQLDSGGERLDAIIAELFRGKGEAYLGRDLPKILRFHTVLGTIFSKKGRWGDRHDPFTAIFQLENARRTLRTLRQENHPSGAPAPGLHLMLAEAYEAVGKAGKAIDSLIDAGREAVALKNLDLTREVLDQRIPALDRKPTVKQKQALDELGHLLEPV